MTRHGVMGRGAIVYQDAIPKSDGASTLTPNGLKLRGVVVRVYAGDDPSNPLALRRPTPMCCDVLIYSAVPGLRDRVLRGCLVARPYAGMHGGVIAKPRAATLDITGNPVEWDRRTNPSNTDGDHVLVEFLENSFHQPVITAQIEHSSADVGQGAKALGFRTKFSATDGAPWYVKHRGAFFGVDDSGNWIVDTTEAHDGELTPEGAQKPPTTDGSRGNVTVRAAAGATVTVEIAGGAALRLSGSGATAQLTLGDGAYSVAVAEHLRTLYADLVSALDAHVHPTGVGPSGTAAAGGFAAPAWNPSIVSSKLTLPDT